MLTGQALLRDIDELHLEPGALAFWWIGQMSFIVKVAETVLYFDPYLAPNERRRVPPMLEPAEVTNADWIFCSHNHGDHLDKYALPGMLRASPQARVVTSRVNAPVVADLGIAKDRIVPIDEGLPFQAGDVTISAIAAAHEFLDRDPVLGYPHLCFIVQIGDVAILHTGDTVRYEGMSTKLAAWQLDLAILPINGRDAVRYARGTIGNMTYQEAVDLAGDLRPRLTVPGHYEMFERNSADPALFTNYMDVKYPHLRHWVGGHGEAIIIPAREA